MKPGLLSCSVGVILSLAIQNSASAAEEQTVDSILAKYITASGGKAALEKVNSRVVKVTIESEAFGPSEGQVFAVPPNKLASHIQLPNAGSIDEGFDGTIGWAKSPWQELRLKSGEELAKTRRDAEFYRILRFKSIYPGLAFKGTEKVGDEEANVIESTPSAKSSEKFWFSVKTGLLIRQDSGFEGPQGSVSTSALPQDYKTVDGIKYPGTLKLKITAGGQTFEMTMKFADIQHNVRIDDAKFVKPSA